MKIKTKKKKISKEKESRFFQERKKIYKMKKKIMIKSLNRKC